MYSVYECDSGTKHSWSVHNVGSNKARWEKQYQSHYTVKYERNFAGFHKLLLVEFLIVSSKR